VRQQTYGYLSSRRASPPLTGTKLYCLLTEAHVCEQLAQGCYLKVEQPGVEPATFCVVSQHPNHYTTRLHYDQVVVKNENLVSHREYQF